MDIYSTIRNVSTIFTAIFAIMSIVTDSKDKNGKLTRWGKVAAVGVVLSAIFSVVIYSLEAAESIASAKKSERQFDETKRKLDEALAGSSHLIRIQDTLLEQSKNLKKSLTFTAGRLGNIAERSKEIGASQVSALRSLEALQKSENSLYLWELKRSLPAVPLTIVFGGDYPMEAPEMATYAKRLRRDFGSYGPPAMPLPPAGDQLYPDQQTEPMAYQALNFEMLFRIWSGSELITAFNCRLEDPGPGEISFNLTDNMLTIYKECDDLYPAFNLVHLSALDLVGKTLTWEASVVAVIGPGQEESSALGKLYPHGLPFKLVSVSLRLPYDPKVDRPINASGLESYTLTAEDLGVQRSMAAPLKP